MPAHLPGLTMCLRYCAVLAVLPCFTSPKALICLRSCCSKREQRQECTLVQLMRGVCAHHCYTNTSSTGQLLACPGAMLKLPRREAAVQQGTREEGAGRHDADAETLLSELQSWSLGTGIGTPSPQGITLMSPGCTDMKRAMLLRAIPPIEATCEISLPSG